MDREFRQQLRLEEEQAESHWDYLNHPLNQDDLYAEELIRRDIERLDGRMPYLEAELLVKHMMSELMFSPEGRRRLRKFRRQRERALR